MANIDTPRLQSAQIWRAFAPPDRVRMCPDGRILPSEEGISVEAVCMQRAQIVILDALPWNRVVIANRYLRQDIVGLNRREDVAWRYFVAQCFCGSFMAE